MATTSAGYVTPDSEPLGIEPRERDIMRHPVFDL